MGNILFEHNQKAYVAAASMLAQAGKAAIIHPTGTGKSFIAFQLCADHLGQKVCLISPSEYIFMTQMEKWRAAGGAELTNIQFFTYARLMRMEEDAMAEIRPDYIILDEFHRCGAAQWGRGVERLREMYPEAKVLGLSATNIRYLDNQRDMAWELFGGNVASELTLGAALAQGILPVPKYVLCVYSYQKELKRYEMRVRQARNKAVRDAAEKELEALRRALEKADGLSEIFARHMLSKLEEGTGNVEISEAKVTGADNTGIIEEKENRTDNAKIAKEKGNRTDSAGIIEGEETGTDNAGITEEEEIGTGNARSEKEQKNGTDNVGIVKAEKTGADYIRISEVKETTPKTRKFGKYIVFCANYEHLLEMRELAAEWFANVDSAPHIYTAYSDERATSEEFEAFKADQSGHLKLLYCIDMLNEGIHVDGVDGVILLRPTVSPTIYKQQIGRALAAGGKKTPVIFDIVMNIENLCSIGAVEEELREAVGFFRANGRGDEVIHERFRVIDEAADSRRLFVQLNETLGASWDAMYAMAKEYYGEHGNLEVPVHFATPDGYSLGAWIATQRKIFSGKTAGCLSTEQVRKLDAIGMRWQGTQETAWERNFAEAKKYYAYHGDLCVPADFVTEDGCRLGRWIRRQREMYQKLAKSEKCKENGMVISGDGEKVPENVGKLSENGRKPLETIGMFLENDAKSTGINPKTSESRRQSVHAERIQRLIQIGMVWENDDPWERKFELAREYYEKHGNLRMAADYVVEGVWLDRWLREQKAKLEEENSSQTPETSEHLPDWQDEGIRAEKRRENLWNANIQTGNGQKVRGALTEEQKQKLASIGIQPGVSQAELSWREQYSEAEEFYRRYGNLSVPKRYTAGNGKNLGIWLQRQRAGRRNGRLAGWQVRMLDGIGMVWDFEDAWEIGFAYAKKYFRENGHLEVPNNYVCADGYRLGKWISNQRCSYGGCAGKELSQEQIRQLEAIGMVWSAKRGRRPGSLREKEAEMK